MDYLIVNTALMVKGKNFPEGGTISDSVLTKEDIKILAKYLKPLNNTNTAVPETSKTSRTRNSKS